MQCRIRTRGRDRTGSYIIENSIDHVLHEGVKFRFLRSGTFQNLPWLNAILADDLTRVLITPSLYNAYNQITSHFWIKRTHLQTMSVEERDLSLILPASTSQHLFREVLLLASQERCTTPLLHHCLGFSSIHALPY